MALKIFLIMNVIGHLPPIAAMVKDYDMKRQRQILLREAFFAFLIATFYLFVGDWFLSTLHINPYTMSCAGGTILLLVALEMIFPHHEEETQGALKREPCIVPIATPMLSGGGVFTTVVILASQADSLLTVWGAIGICSAATALILLVAPFIQKLIGKRGLLAMEQLTGMIVVMMAVQMLVRGAHGLIAQGYI